MKNIDAAMLRVQSGILRSMINDDSVWLKREQTSILNGECANSTFTSLVIIEGLENLVADMLDQLYSVGEVHYKRYEEDRVD